MIKYVLAIQSLVIIILVFLLTVYGRDEFHKQENDETIESESFAIKGNRLILSNEVQGLIGLKVEKAKSKTYTFSHEFPGLIMPVTDLIEAQRDTKILNLAINETASKLEQRQQDLSRILNLFKAGKKASSRQLELAELEVEENEKVLKGLIEEREFLKLKIMASWSGKISNMLGSKNPDFLSIINKKIQIVRFATREQLEIDSTKWWVKRVGETSANRVTAQLIGNAGSTVLGDIGKAWLIKSKSLDLPSNSPIIVVSESTKQLQGVEIPPDSLVRYAGKSWLYVKVANDEFARKNVPENFPTEFGYFTDVITPNEIIVTRGAQTLLSEELKHLITNENED